MTHRAGTDPHRHDLFALARARWATLKRTEHSAQKRALFLVSCAAALGCSNRSSERAFGAEQQASEPLTAAPQCSPAISAPRSVSLTETFSVSVPSGPPGTSFDWDGDGLRISPHGSSATLQCAWSGWHTLTVAMKSPGCGPRSAQIYCRPSACQDPLDPSCPGIAVSVREPTACPKTNVLLAMPSMSSCPSEIAGAGGKWVGGWLLRAPHSESDPRPHLCSYFWEAPPRHEPDTSVLPDATGAWQWDCPRVAAHGEYAAMNQTLAELGRAHLGAIEWTSDAPPVPVRIAVVDTAAGPWQTPDNNPHGQAVGALALDTACPDAASCNVNLLSYLGLPLYRDRTPNGGAVIRRDVQHGGDFGAQGPLARAILDAVNAAPEQRTVLNLSLAYESDELPASLLPERGDFANRAVLEALRYARCHGALILAAAGNGPVPAVPGQAPGLPARWTALPGLSEQQCRDRFGVARQASADAPLLYAVTGEDFGGQPLLTTRGAGQSVLTALGFAAVREEPNGGYTRTLTGTSVATAAVSGIAALLWGHASELSPDSVIEELYAGSPITPIPPDFKPFQPALAAAPFDTVRRITRCSIASPGLGLAVCTQLAAPIAALPADTLPELPADAPELVASAPTQPGGGVSPWTFPFIFPQPPGDPGCGICTWRFGPHRLDLALRPSFPVGSVSNMQLLASTTSGAAAARFAALSSETSTVTPIADIVADTDPFSVLLEEGLVANSAELTYQIDVDGVMVDVTESVVLEAAQ